MHLQRVQVPNFRALKNIDITFEKERVPRIFPLASLNGGGKSTLLQLIFTLLTCSAEPDKHEFLVNILKDFEVDYELGSKLAKIDIFDGETVISLDFTCQRTCLLVDQFLPSSQETIDLKDSGFTEISKKLLLLERIIEDLRIDRETIVKKIINLHDQMKSIDKKKNNLNTLSSYIFTDGVEVVKIEEYEKELDHINWEIDTKTDECRYVDVLQRYENNIKEKLLSDNVHYVSSYRLNDNCDEVSILCHISSNTNTDILQEISKRVFLAAPASQVFLFFNRQEIDCLFDDRTSITSYESIAQKIRIDWLGFSCTIFQQSKF